nr:PREDICTED: LOW QUALITY PROTEIN: proline-rich protein 7 [Bos mutus]
MRMANLSGTLKPNPAFARLLLAGLESPRMGGCGGGRRVSDTGKPYRGNLGRDVIPGDITGPPRSEYRVRQGAAGLTRVVEASAGGGLAAVPRGFHGTASPANLGRGSGLAESDMSKPPCYEEAVMRAEPAALQKTPPPYSELLTATRGLYRKIVTPFLSRRDSAEKQEQPPPSYKPLFLDRGYTSALHLPSAPRPAPPCPALCLQSDRGRRVFPSWTDSELSSREPLEHGAWRLPVSIPLFGRTTAV